MIGTTKKYRTNDKTTSKKALGIQDTNTISYDGTAAILRDQVTANSTDYQRPTELSNPVTSNNFSQMH